MGPISIMEYVVVASSMAAFLVSFYTAVISRRSMRRLKILAAEEGPVRKALIRAVSDGHFSEEEMRLVVRLYRKKLGVDKPFYRTSSMIDSRAGDILTRAVDNNNENLFIELASAVEALGAGKEAA